MRIIVGLFEAPNISRVTQRWVKSFLAKFNLTNKIFTYMKDEVKNLTTLATTMSNVGSYAPLDLQNRFMHMFILNI